MDRAKCTLPQERPVSPPQRRRASNGATDVPERASAEDTSNIEKLIAVLEKRPSLAQDGQFVQFVDKLSSLVPPKGATAENNSSNKRANLDAEVQGLKEEVERLQEALNDKDAQLQLMQDEANRHLRDAISAKDAEIERLENNVAGFDKLLRDVHEERKAWAGFSNNDIRSHILSISVNEVDDTIRPSTNSVPSQFLVEESFHHADILYPGRLDFDEHAMYRFILEIIGHKHYGPIFPNLPRRFQGDLWKIWMALEKLDDDHLRGRLAAPMFMMVLYLAITYRDHGIDATSMWITSQIAHYFYRYNYKPTQLSGEARAPACAMRDWAQMTFEQEIGQVLPPVTGVLQALQTRYPHEVSQWDCSLKGEQSRLIYLGSGHFNLDDEIVLITVHGDGRWAAWLGQRRNCALFQLSFRLYLMADRRGDAASAMIVRFDEDYWLPHRNHLRGLFPRQRKLQDEDMQPLQMIKDWR